MRIHGKEYDPYTGITTTYGSQDDKMVVKSDADVSAALDYAGKLRNAPEYAKGGIKRSWMHGAHIPDVVILKMKAEDGFDCYTANAREIRQFLNKNKDKYGYLFTTQGTI